MSAAPPSRALPPGTSAASAATSTAPLYGLVLAGGHSRRMQRDKASLPYVGRSQLQRAMELLSPRVQRAFVSIRTEQRSDPARTAYSCIADLQPDLGPIGGIHAALHTHPDHAWLVLACDLPFLTATTLDHLIASRAADRIATAYRSSFDGLPEPLCAIFEPASRAAVDDWIAQGQRCPRALLQSAATRARLLEPFEPRALDNVNTPEQYAAATAQLEGAASAAPAAASAPGPHLEAPPLRLRVRYFALLREQAGRGDEQLQTRARTALELYRELQQRRGLALAPEFLRVAINDEFGDWRTSLAEGDTVAFLPPVAGG